MEGSDREPINLDTNEVEVYLGRCRGLLILLEDQLAPEAVGQIASLIDHGEPAEGMCYLAWGIVNGGIRVPAWMVNDLRDLTHNLVADEDMPPGLDACIEA